MKNQDYPRDIPIDEWVANKTQDYQIRYPGQYGTARASLCSRYDNARHYLIGAKLPEQQIHQDLNQHTLSIEVGVGAAVVNTSFVTSMAVRIQEWGYHETSGAYIFADCIAGVMSVYPGSKHEIGRMKNFDWFRKNIAVYLNGKLVPLNLTYSQEMKLL